LTVTVPNLFGTENVSAAACSLDFYTADIPVKAEVTKKAITVKVTKKLTDKWIAVWI